jgi:hypothetical protein
MPELAALSAGIEFVLYHPKVFGLVEVLGSIVLVALRYSFLS